MSQQTPKKRVLFVRRSILALLVIFGVFAFVISLTRGGEKAYAATQSTINFQARLQSAAGNIVPDGFYNVEFKLYSVSSGGSALWTEDYYDSNGVTAGNDNRVQVINGYLTVSLGSQTAFPGTINWDQQLWLTMNIGGTTQTATPTYDGEMTPRLQLTAVPYAFKAGQLAQYNGTSGFTSTLNLVQPTVGNQTFQIPDQGASGTFTILTTNAANTGYIQNQNASAQTSSNFWLSGTGKADIFNAVTALQTGGITRVDNSGNLTNIGNITGTGNLQLSGTGTSYLMGALGLGTTNPQSTSALTIANSEWISSVDSAGTGYVNMFQVNSNNQIQVGAALNIDGGIIFPTNGGRLTFADLPIDSSATAGTKESYTMRVGSTNALTVYGESDGSGGVQNVRVGIGSVLNPSYTLDAGGDINTSGVVRTNGTQRLDASGVLSSVTYQGNTIGAQYGGTGQSSYAVGDILYANTTTSLGKLADVATGSCLISGGLNTAPTWGSCSTGVTGSFIQNQNASAQSSSNFWISGTGKADILNAVTALQTNGTTRIDASGNLSNIGNIAGSGTLQLSGTSGSSYIMSALGLGTTNPQAGSAVTIANSSWISAIDSAGTGYVNMFQVNSNNQIQVGAALNIDGAIILPTNGGQLTFADLPIDTTATAGTAESYSFRIGTSNVLTVYGEADGSGNLQNGRVAIGTSIAPAYTLDVAGDVNTTGNLRINGTTTISSAGVLQSAALSGTYSNALTFSNASNSFTGVGTNLTALNATNLASGTVNTARISGSYTGITGTGALAAGSIASGFGTISTGNNITTSALLQGNTLNVGSTQQFAVDATGRLSVITATGGPLIYAKESGSSYANAAAAIVADTDNPTGTSNYLFQGRLTGTNVFSVRADGLITGVGVNSGTGLLQGSGGFTLTGTTAINTTGTANTSIGNATGTVTIVSNGGLNATSAGVVTAGTYNGQTISSSASFTGTLQAASTITGTTINGTTGINTGAGAGTQRIDASGNLVNIGTIKTTGSLATTANNVTTYQNVYSWGTTTSTQTGTLEMILPNGWNNSMLRFQISGYDYSGAGAWQATIAGYNYSTTPAWINTSADASSGAPFTSVRLAYDTALSKNVLLLGTTSTVWNFPQFSIDEVVVGYGNQSVWGSGYSSAFLTSEASISNINSPVVATVATTANAFLQGGNSFGATAVLGTIDNNSLQIKTNNVTRFTIDTSGNGTLTGTFGSGAITSSSTITGTTINGTTGINTGAGAGTNRIDVSGNLVNIGTITSGLINGQTISSAANFTGSLTAAGSIVSGPANQQIILSSGAGNHGIEIGRGDGSSSTPYIDFHSGTTFVDHDARIIVSGGSGSNDGGTLTLTAALTNVSGSLQTGGTTRLSNAGVVSNITGYTQSSGNATFNQNAADQFKVIALQAPTTDMVNISNSGFPITTDGINGQQIDYFTNLSNAAYQSSGLRVNTTNTSTVAGSTASGVRIVATANVASNTNGIKIDNITSGAGTDSALYLGTGWDNLLSYNGTQIINGTGILQSAALSGSYTGITGTGALTAGSIASGFGTIATGNTIQGTVLISTIASGTAPLTVTSNTKVTNLNADLLDGLDSTAFAATTGGTGYIQNQNASAQSSSNFWISGTGTANALYAGTIDSPSGTTTLNIGTTNATTGINIGGTGLPTTVQGNLTANQNVTISGTYTTSNNNRLLVGGTMASSVTTSQYGIQNSVNFTPTGASLGTLYGAANTPSITGSSIAVTNYYGSSFSADTAAGYTGLVSNAAAISVSTPTIGGSQKYSAYQGILVNANSVNGGNTTGTLNNYQIRTLGLTAGAGTGGTVNNYGINILQPAGTGGTTNNYGLYLSGAGAGTSSYSIYNASTASSYFASDILMGASANIDMQASGTLAIGTGSTSTGLNLGGSSTATTSVVATTTLNLGNNANNKTINIGATGSTANTTTVNIANTSGNSTQAVNIGSNGNTSNAVTIDGGTGVSGIAIGNSSTAHGIQIGTGTGGTNAIKIGGSGATSGSNASTVVTMQGGQTSLSVANAGATVQSFTNSTTALQIQNSSGTSFLTADSVNQIITTKDLNVGDDANIGGAGRLFSDSFESGNNKLWDQGATVGGSSSLTAETTIVRNGKYSLKMTNNNGASYLRTSITGATTTDIRGYVYIGSQTTGPDGDLLRLGGTNNFILYRDSATGKLTLWNSAAGTVTVGSTVLTTGAWHQIELLLTVNATTGAATVYLDGTAVITQTSINTGSVNPTFAQVGDADATNVMTAYFDDITVDTVRPGDSASLNVADSLHVSGSSSFGGIALFQAASNSTNAFQIQNASGTNFMNVDTANGTIVFGSTNTITIGNNGEFLFAGTARHARKIVLAPEFTGAVLDASADATCSSANSGTLTSGLDLTNRKNYYSWISTSGTAQCYDVVVQVPVPADWAAWGSTTPLKVNAYTSNTTNGTANIELRDSTGSVIYNYITVTPGSTSTWVETNIGTTISGTYTPGDYLTLRIRVSSLSSAEIRLGNITLDYLSKW